MQYAHVQLWPSVLCALPLTALTLALSAQAEPPLHTAAEVLALSPEQARNHQEVH